MKDFFSKYTVAIVAIFIIAIAVFISLQARNTELIQQSIATNTQVKQQLKDAQAQVAQAATQIDSLRNRLADLEELNQYTIQQNNQTNLRYKTTAQQRYRELSARTDSLTKQLQAIKLARGSIPN